ncbi:MAG: YIP1 family protein [Betaproteobacteria bacterium]|nr:YIP1 family protein [Betaproteobacteria bacterium]
MNLVERVKKILLQPRSEWEVIRGEQTPAAELYRGYIIPLAAIGAVAGFIGFSLVGISVPMLGTQRMPIPGGLAMALATFAMGLVAVYAVAFIINALAPRFGARQDMAQALKVAAYSYTPGWLAGALQILPMLSPLILLASLYGLYLLHLGLQALMQGPKEKALPYTAVVVVCAFVVSLVLGMVASGIGGMAGGVAATAPAVSSGGGDDQLAKMKEFGEKMEAAGRKMEEAQKSGDPQAQMKAATEAMGALAGASGGREPVDHQQLRAVLPEALDGLARTEIESQKVGMGGAHIARAEAHYADDQGRGVQISITDSGGAQALLAVAGFGMIESDKESADGYEKTGKAGGRFFRESYRKSAREASYATIVAERFVVEAEGRGVDMAVVKQALERVDLGRLEGMKGR